MSRRLEASEGVFRIDGEDRLLLVADYPYYRDDVRNWPDRLRAQAEAGLDVLSCYVPWRHHAHGDPLAGGSYDFEGATQPNRNLVRLIELARGNALKVILKPGPFVHAELAYGGLPDHVEPSAGNGIEAELDASGHPRRWPTAQGERRARALPAPFDARYLRQAHDWLEALASRALRGRTWPEGPVIAIQLLNEGIYSDSSDASPLQMGFSKSTLARYRAFRRERGLSEGDEPPRRVDLLREPRDLLPYLDWSAFHGVLYHTAASEYAKALHRAGVPEDLPIVFNFNPNIETYRTKPASNDGWYTRVNLAETEFTFGSTNWVGVVAGDPQAFRQYVMAMTAFRGPCMEQNWGFSSQYFAPYEFVTPSHFESMIGLACGATGMAAYPLASTRVWRDDANLGDETTQARTSERDDDTSGDYPGSAAILSSGERTPKYWTLMQMARYFRSEGPRFARYGPHAPIAWAIYAPYAWAGQWLPRGDPDDILWRPPLRAVPRGAYHGLDAFVEVMTRAGVGFRQVEITRDTSALARTRILCISGHEYMDLPAQERLAAWVERGGRLLLTNLVADRDERMRGTRGALGERVFPHRVVERLKVAEPEPLELDGLEAGKALEFAFAVEPPGDARPILRLRGRCVGYERDVGAGKVVFAGVGPWRAVHSNDDAALARANQDFTWRLLQRLGVDAIAPAAPMGSHGGEIIVWQHGDPARDEQHVFVVVREARGEIRVRVTRPDGARIEVDLRSPSQSVHAFALESGHLRACYLKGVNDMRGERVAPSIRIGREEWGAEDPCDLCVVPSVEGFEVAVAHLKGAGETRVRGLTSAPLPVAELAASGFARVPASGRRGSAAP